MQNHMKWNSEVQNRVSQSKRRQTQAVQSGAKSSITKQGSNSVNCAQNVNSGYYIIGSGHESSSRNPSWRSLNPPLQTRGLQAQESKCRIPKPASQPQESNCRKSNPTIQTSNASAGIQTQEFQPRHPNPGIQKQDSKIEDCKSRKSSPGLQTQHFRSMNANTENQI